MYYIIIIKDVTPPWIMALAAIFLLIIITIIKLIYYRKTSKQICEYCYKEVELTIEQTKKEKYICPYCNNENIIIKVF